MPFSDVPAENLLSASERCLRHFSRLICLATLVLIFLGGQVKSHEAGLSVPDWPLTYGENPITYPLSKWTGGIFYEHFHRLFAGGVATATVLLAVWLQLADRRRWLKALGWLAVLAVVAQAVLGGLTVIFQLPVLVSSSHAILAQGFFVVTCVIAYALSKEHRRRELESPSAVQPVFRAALLLISLTFVQLFLGALMRHTESGLAIPDFPTTAGRIIPVFNEESLTWVNDWRFEHDYEQGVHLAPVTIGQMLIHFSHRVGAVAVTLGVLLVVAMAWRQRREEPRVAQTALALLAVVFAQVILGVFTVWSLKLPLITSIHVMTGAALLGVAVLVALRAYPVRTAAVPASAEKNFATQRMTAAGNA